MIHFALLACYAPVKQVDKTSLSYTQQTFVVRSATAVTTVPLLPEPEQKTLSIAFRKDKTWAVWDERGLTIRVGEDVRSTRLDEISVSPRIFERPEILQTMAAVKDGSRKREATGLSGSRRVGNVVYLVPRWEDKAGKPWLEVLVRVDLTAIRPKPELLARFQGLSPARSPIDKWLRISAGRLSLPIQQAGKWGLAYFDPAAVRYDFKELGETLQFMSLEGNYIEKTAFGSFLVGKLDFEAPRVQLLAECKGPAKFVDQLAPGLVTSEEPDGSFLRNLSTGQMAEIAQKTSVRRVGNFAIVFSPTTSPNKATAYRVDTLQAVATWTK